MEDHVEEIAIMLGNDYKYIEICDYLTDEDREYLKAKIIVAVDLLSDCAELMKKKRNEAH